MVGFKFLRTGSLAPGPAKNRFSHSQSPEKKHAGWPDINPKVDLLLPTDWYSLAKEIIDFSYFPKL